MTGRLFHRPALIVKVPLLIGSHLFVSCWCCTVLEGYLSTLNLDYSVRYVLKGASVA